MKSENIWLRGSRARIMNESSDGRGLDIGFDPKISHETETELRRFAAWAQSSFRFPVSLWVDFEYKHYLMTREGKRVGYLFYWADWDNYPVFSDPDKGPSIRLPVRTEKYSLEEILTSFIEAISDYFAWLLNELTEDFIPSEQDTEEILEAYLLHQKQNTELQTN